MDLLSTDLNMAVMALDEKEFINQEDNILLD